MPVSSTVLLRLLVQLVVLAALCILVADAFILQELPLYRPNRNYDTDAFDRAVRGSSLRLFGHRAPQFYHQYARNF
uniref:Uncharacterized protein n=1 Tax=Panagrellus redivivus TaxID=6233 RepID=A0A7E4ZQV3_PANRE